MTTETTETTSLVLPDDIVPRALSRHAGGLNLRWGLQALNTNAWSNMPGNPFAGQFVLQPNSPDDDAISVIYGPVRFPTGIDALTVFIAGAGRPHENVLCHEIEVLDPAHRTMAAAQTEVRHGEEPVATVRFDLPPSGRIFLRFTVEFSEFVSGSAYGSVRLHYMTAYRHNPLVELFNGAGSDKGTEIYFGGGVPHCYALDYHPLFEHLRTETFNMLEIGLENASKEDGEPEDAPSLRAWRAYFPQAQLYGYDINDFSFFDQERTVTFQGDQRSPEDIERFLETNGRPRFGMILDDGSHASSHQQISLARLFGSVAPGGLYVIEDLQWQPFPEAITTLEVLTNYLETGQIKTPFIAAADARALEESIEEVRIYKPNDAEFAVLKKRA